MKIKNCAIVASLLLSAFSFAQKDELKSAEKALKAGNADEAKTILTNTESMIANADDSSKAQYYFLLGNANLELAKKNTEVGKNLIAAAKAYNTLTEIEKKGKAKYSAQTQANLSEVKRLLTNDAIADSNAQRYKESALKLNEVYNLDKKDTTMLYYAAGTALNAKDYDLALDYYKKLKDLNYSGKATHYLAKSKINDQEQQFASKSERDQSVKLGTHTTPRDEKIDSKRGEIAKNLSLILIEKGDVAAAKKAVAEARKSNPEDISLIMSEADLYLKTNDYATYKTLISEVLAKDPNNVDLYYNLGVISAQSKDKQAKLDAEGYYLKTIQLDPKYKNAYINLTVLKLDGEAEIVKDMNKLGMSDADMKKYNALKAKRENMYKSAIPYLEKAFELMPTDKDIKTTLLNMYNALDMTEKAKALKAK